MRAAEPGLSLYSEYLYQIKCVSVSYSDARETIPISALEPGPAVGRRSPLSIKPWCGTVTTIIVYCIQSSTRQIDDGKLLRCTRFEALSAKNNSS